MIRSLPCLLVAVSAGPALAFDLHGAVDAAAPGDTIRVPSGVHVGPVVIDRTLVLEGEAGAAIDGGGAGDVIRVMAPDVVVRGLGVRGTGTAFEHRNSGIAVLAPGATVEDNVLEDVLFGITVESSPDSRVRGNRIRGLPLDIARRGDAIRLWASDRTVVEDNDVADARDVVVWYSKDVEIRRNRIVHGRYGLHFMYADGAVLEGNRLEGNSVGAYLMYSRKIRLTGNVLARSRGPSGFGLGLKDADDVEVHANSIVGNRVGVYLDNSPWSVDSHDLFDGNLIAYNDIGVTFLPAVRRNRFRGNAFVDNLEQVAVQGGGTLQGNEFTADGRGNHWSDYAGYDLAGDGVGDVPYRSESLFENLMDREKSLRLFLFSPAQQAVELAARSLPAIRPRSKIEDAAPLVDAPMLAAPPLAAAARWPLALLSAVLGAGSAIALRRATRAGYPVARALEAAHAPATSALRVRGLGKRYGPHVVLEDVAFDVQVGEAVALWGHNGAGKTTAIRCLLGLSRCAGSLLVLDAPLERGGKEARRRLGYVPQELALHDDMRTDETLAFYARLKRVGGERPAEVLAEVGMAAHAGKRIRELSGGMKQRVALAVALLADPPILVLDEMTSNLDQAGRGAFLVLLADLKARGKTILFTSHRLDEVRLLADRVVVLDRGRVRAVCPPAGLPDALGLTATARIRVPLDRREDALRALAGAGIDAPEVDLEIDTPGDQSVPQPRRKEA